MTDEPGTKVAETHISTVFFTPTRAFKVLKPVRTAFLDHQSVDARLNAVNQELELNRRMAPDVYLGTADVVETGTDGTESVTDRMLVMKRLPERQRLTRLLHADAIDDHLRAIARCVAAFHSTQEPLFGPDAEMARRDAVRKNWHDNTAEIERHAGVILDPSEVMAVQELAARYLDTNEAVFDNRIEQGFVRDGHGDLRAEDIFCTDDGPRILDCLAFDERLRKGDVLLDIAFLGMDLDRLAGTPWARRFMLHYREFSNEKHPSSLAHHYVAYRAHVRTKIACLRHLQGDPSAAAEARSYHALAHHHLRRGEVRLVLVGGGAGVGKSTVASGLSDAMGWMVLNSDELRKDMAGLTRNQRVDEAPGAGLYSDENKERVYRELLREACQILRAGESVILDASWNSEHHRDLARATAKECGVPITELECALDPAVARERIARRMADTNTPSDATPEIADHLRRLRDPWPGATRIDTGPAVREVQVRALATVRV